MKVSDPKRCTCGLYTKAMQNKRLSVKYCWMTVLIVLMAVSCSSKKSKLAKLMADTGNGMVQVKRANHKTIVMELLPQYDLSAETKKNEPANFYKVKLLLRNDKKINGAAAMQYINFDIKNSICAVQRGDTLPCAVFERIPGINENEYVYMIFFNKETEKNGVNDNLQILVNDTIAGFGTTMFEIKSESLKKLEAIKYMQ